MISRLRRSRQQRAKLSNDAAASTPPVAPATIQPISRPNLTVSGSAASVTLDLDGNPATTATTGTASAYDVRYSTTPINAATFASRHRP